MMSEAVKELVTPMTPREMLRWCHDPDCSPNEQFEDINDWFYRETGNLRPGKSDIRGIPEKTRLQSWDKWLLEKQRAYRAGLLAIAAVEREAHQPDTFRADALALAEAVLQEDKDRTPWIPKIIKLARKLVRR